MSVGSLPQRVAGVELGGTKCICTLARGPGEVEDQVVLPTSDPKTTLGEITGHLRRWHKHQGFAALGIGTFGPVDLDPGSKSLGCIQRTPKPGWSGAPVYEAIAGAFDLPAILDTDVNGAALAEKLWGSGRDVQDIAYITVGTGIGVGFADERRSARGRTHAEFGHIRVVRNPEDDRTSVCPFHSDCVEGLASGKAISAGLSDAAIRSLTDADRRWEAPIVYLGQLCHTILCASGPKRIALGGGALTAFPSLVSRIEDAMRESLNSYLSLPDAPILVPAQLGGNAGPLGSIALGIEALASAEAAGRPSHGGSVQ